MPISSSLLFSKKKKKKGDSHGTMPPSSRVSHPCPTLVGLKALTEPDRSSANCVNRHILSAPSSASSLSTSYSPMGSDTDSALGEVKGRRGQVVQCDDSEGGNGDGGNRDGSDDDDDDDCSIGEEKKNEEEEGEEQEEGDDTACWAFYGWRDGVRRFPPVIPLLARTGNLSCHMPWVLMRTYKEDGSLVIQEVRVKHHEYFRARRAKGRLTLKLVRMDETVPSLATIPVYQGGAVEQQLNPEPDSTEEQYQPSVAPPPPPPLSSSLLEPERCVEEERANISVDGPEQARATRDEPARTWTGKLKASSSPGHLSSSMPELTSGGIGKGCSGNRSTGSLFQMPFPTLRPVRS